VGGDLIVWNGHQVFNRGVGDISIRESKVGPLRKEAIKFNGVNPGVKLGRILPNDKFTSCNTEGEVCKEKRMN